MFVEKNEYDERISRAKLCRCNPRIVRTRGNCTVFLVVPSGKKAGRLESKYDMAAFDGIGGQSTTSEVSLEVDQTIPVSAP